MVWVRIDDGALLHPKLLRAGPEGVALWLAGLCYANAHTTDGQIPAAALPALYPVEAWTPRKVRALAEHLVTCGLWHPADAGGYTIHGYEEYQHEATREEVERKREDARIRKRRSRGGHSVTDDKVTPTSQRDRGGLSRGGHSVTPPHVTAPRPVPSRPNTPLPPKGGCSDPDSIARSEAQRALLAAAAKGDA